MKRNSPVILAVSGVKNSGKTRLIEALIPLLTSRGMVAAVIKHDGHSFTPDTPGTDSFRFFAAGAAGAAVFDGEKFSMTCRAKVDEKYLASMFPGAGIVLMEGFKDSDWPKIEIVRSGICRDTVCDPESCVAYVSDLPLAVGKPVFRPDEFEKIADFIVSFAEEAQNA